MIAGMSVLNDWEIADRAERTGLITPFKRERVQPASYDLALGNEFIVFDAHEQVFLDLASINDASAKKVHRTPEQGFTLHPGEFVLGVTEEVITLENGLVARLEGKSSIGRLGLLIHVTAGFVDPGWSGSLTLEIYNVRKVPIILRPGLPFCQISFQLMAAPAHQAYSGRYQGAAGVEASKYGQTVTRDGRTVLPPLGEVPADLAWPEGRNHP